MTKKDDVLKELQLETIKELKEELERITGFIGEYGTEEENKEHEFSFACNICDGLDWILGEISTEGFKSDAYLDLAKLKIMVTEIEQRTGKNFSHYS